MQLNEEQKESLRESAASYWEAIDVDKFQPIFHGSERTEEQKQYAEAEMKKIKELTAEYREKTGEKAPEFEHLFPHLEK
jgi:hypothetical protein